MVASGGKCLPLDALRQVRHLEVAMVSQRLPKAEAKFRKFLITFGSVSDVVLPGPHTAVIWTTSHPSSWKSVAGYRISN